MSRAKVFRVGDRVRILEPKFIDRVGYPIHWASLVPDFRQHPKMLDAMKLLGMIPADSFKIRGRVALAFAQGCAKAQNELNGLGGTERSIHYLGGDWGSYAEGEHEITAKRTVRTGVYYAPSGGSYPTEYGEEYDYQNGGLDDAKTHVLLRLGNSLEIEARNVVAA